MNVRHPMGVLHSFSNKNVFYDKMDSGIFYFHVTTYTRHKDICIDDLTCALPVR